MCQLPFPFLFLSQRALQTPPLPLFPSYNLGQECFNFRDRFCLSSEAGWPVVQAMRCDGCKTIKKKKRSGRWERTKKKRAHFIGQI